MDVSFRNETSFFMLLKKIFANSRQIYEEQVSYIERKVLVFGTCIKESQNRVGGKDMLSDITKIKISGAIFNTETTLDLFNPYDGDKLKTTKGTLLYGRNGTGKSTIAKAFRKLAGEFVPTISSTTVCNDSDQPLNLSEEEKKRIFVFDEEYVDKNVRLQQNHLETIVMLGPTVDLTEKIEKAEKELLTSKEVYEQQDIKYREYLYDDKVQFTRDYTG